MAQTIYKEWFVNFRFPGYEKTKFIDSPLGRIPEKWKISEFKNFFKIYNGYAFKSKDYSTKGIKLVRTQDYSETKYVISNIDVHIPEESLNIYEKFLLTEYDFLVIMVGASLGKYGIILSKNLPALQNQNQWAIRPITNLFSKFYLILMMPDFIIQVKSFATGAAREFFRKEHFYEQDIIIPNKKILDAFDENIYHIFSEINVLLQKNQNLRKTRDILLPKLISGEVPV